MKKIETNSKKTNMIITIVIFLILFITFDLYAANENKTQLEINKYVFNKNENDNRELRQIDYLGNAILIKPVSIIKNNTENILLNDIATITHEEINKKEALFRNNIKQKHDDGPKISLSF